MKQQLRCVIHWTGQCQFRIYRRRRATESGHTSLDDPVNTRFFKVPHHGADNGILSRMGTLRWLSVLPSGAEVRYSHVFSHLGHPSTRVLSVLQSQRLMIATSPHLAARLTTEVPIRLKHPVVCTVMRHLEKASVD